MKHPASRDLYAYWNGLRGERSAPRRSEIDPAAIRTVLADTFMLDVDEEGRYPFRLAGTRVNALLGAEQKDRSFLDIWQPAERLNIAAVLLTVTDGGCAVVAGGATAPRGRDGRAPQGRDECAVELLLLPLRHHGKTHSRVLGSIKAATPPAWLGHLPAGPLTLRSLRVLDGTCDAGPTSAIGRAGDDRDLAGDDMAMPAGVAGTLDRSRPYLRLIHGGL